MSYALDRAGSYEQQAEYDLIGCILMAPEYVMEQIQPILAVSDFQTQIGKAVYMAAIQLINSNSPIDAVLIQEQAKKNGEDIDTLLLAKIIQTYVTPVNAAETARIVRERAIQKEIENVGFALMQKEINAADAVDLLNRIQNGETAKVFSPSEAANNFMDTVVGVSDGSIQMFRTTGFPQLDEVMGGGLIRNGMITLAARPGCGKTTLGLAIADNVAATGAKVLYESLEMSSYQLWARRTARMGRLSYSKIQNGTINDQEWVRLNDATKEISKRPFYINDKPASMDDIEKRARAMKVDFLVIDHMGLVKPEGNRGTKYEEATKISHRIKRLALALDIPILSLCQLNRASEQRSDKRPTLADLRDTGAIEEDSDAVILLHRPTMYMPKDEQPKPWETQDIEVIVDKNRHGSTGKIDMDFVGMTSTVREKPRRTYDY